MSQINAEILKGLRLTPAGNAVVEIVQALDGAKTVALTTVQAAAQRNQVDTTAVMRGLQALGVEIAF